MVPEARSIFKRLGWSSAAEDSEGGEVLPGLTGRRTHLPGCVLPGQQALQSPCLSAATSSFLSNASSACY